MADGITAGAAHAIPVPRRRHTVLWASLMLIVLIAAASGWDIYAGWRAHQEVVNRQMATLTEVAASQVESSVRAIDVLLEDAAKSIDLDRWPDEETAAWLKTRIAAFPEIRNFIVVDAAGRMIGPNISLKDTRANVLDLSDREYFQVQRDHWRDNALAITAPVISRLHNVPSLPLSRPLTPRNGRFSGAVVVGLDPAYFEAKLRTVAAGEGAAAALLRRDGIFLARAPDGDQFRGRSVADGALFAEYLPQSSAGVVRLPALRDSGDSLELSHRTMDRLVGYRTLDNYPLLIAVSAPLPVAFREWRQRVMQGVATVLVLAATVLVLAFLLERRETARAHLAAKLDAHRRELEQRVAERTEALERALGEIQRSEECYRVLFSGSRVPMLLIEPADGSIVDANRAASAYYGHGIDVLKGMRISDINILSREDVAAAIEKAKTEGLSHFHFRHRLANGDIRDVEVHSGPVELKGRNLLYSIIHDITERKRAEERLNLLLGELRQSEERFRLLFNSSNDFVWLHRADPATGVPVGHFIEVNDVACRRLGYRHDEMLVMGPADIDAPSTPTVDDKVRSLATNDWAVFERIHVAKNGRHIPVEINAKKITYRGETMVLAICRDISERKSLEEDLKRSNAELEQFAYVASHDLRQPLRLVTSYLTLIERRLADKLDDDGREFIGYARDGAVHMDHLIRDLLEYSRVGRHGQPPESVDLADMAAEAGRLLQVLVEETACTLEVGTEPAVVTGNRSELVRLFQNLIGNAVKYRAPNRPPHVEVHWRQQDGDWLVSVKDNGIGIAPECHEDVFRIFRRLHTSREYEGTGIGLAICQKIVKNHGGHVWIGSDDEIGTTFFFTLPSIR